MWRGDRRSGLSVAASCVWRCPSTLAVIPFPHPVHRTGLADLPHPALGQDITPARVTPSAVSEHWPELLGCPISAPSLASCVSPEPRLLPSTGITRLPQYYEPLRHPTAPGASLAGLRLPIPGPRRGASRVACVFLVYMLPPLPRRSGWVPTLLNPPAVSTFPERVTGSVCASTFSRLAQRSLTLRPAHSRCHQFVTCIIPKASTVSLPPQLR